MTTSPEIEPTDPEGWRERLFGTSATPTDDEPTDAAGWRDRLFPTHQETKR